MFMFRSFNELLNDEVVDRTVMKQTICVRVSPSFELKVPKISKTKLT